VGNVPHVQWSFSKDTVCPIIRVHARACVSPGYGEVFLVPHRGALCVYTSVVEIHGPKIVSGMPALLLSNHANVMVIVCVFVCNLYLK